MAEILFLDGLGFFVNTEPFLGCGWPWIPVLSFMVLQLQTGSWSTGHTKGLFPHSAYFAFLPLIIFVFESLMWTLVHCLIWKKKRQTFLYSMKLKVMTVYLSDSGSWGNIKFEKVGWEPMLGAIAWQCRWVLQELGQPTVGDLIELRWSFPIGSGFTSHIYFKGSQLKNQRKNQVLRR